MIGTTRYHSQLIVSTDHEYGQTQRNDAEGVRSEW